MDTRKRCVFMVVAVLLGAVVLAACSGDETIDETNDQIAIDEGLAAWRTAVVEQAKADRSAAIKSGLKDWRQAVADNARLTAAVRVEQARAVARVTGDALRLGTTVDFGDRAVEIEQLRAKARVEGDALRLGFAEFDDRAVEIEQLRAQARVEGDRLRSPSNALVLWTEAGQVEVDRQVWADALAPLMATSAGHIRAEGENQCVGPRVVAHSLVTESTTEAVLRCSAVTGMWVNPSPQIVTSVLSFKQG